MTDPCKDIECIVLSDSDDDEPVRKIPRREEKSAANAIELPVDDDDHGDTTGGNRDASTGADEAAVVDAEQEEEQSVLSRECPVLGEHSYAAGSEDAAGDGPGIDDQDRGVVQQLRPAPAFSAQLLQESIAAMKALRLPSIARTAAPARKTVITTRTIVVVPKLAETCDPINILEPCRPGIADSISLDDAIALVRAPFNEGEHDGNFIFYCVRNATIGDSTNRSLPCGVCRGGILKPNVLAHFLAPEHIEKMRARDAAVSLPAVQLWLRELQQAKDALAAEADAE